MPKDLPAIAIRLAKPDDTPAIAAAHVQADWETYAPIFGAKTVRRDFGESLARWQAALVAGDVLLVAEDGDRIVGFVHAGGDWMSALYLLGSHHRRGIGTRLLARACERLVARGVEEIGFTAVAANANAIAFYEARGARQTGLLLKEEAGDSWEEAVFRLSTAPLAASRRG